MSTSAIRNPLLATAAAGMVISAWFGSWGCGGGVRTESGSRGRSAGAAESHLTPTIADPRSASTQQIDGFPMSASGGGASAVAPGSGGELGRADSPRRPAPLPQMGGGHDQREDAGAESGAVVKHGRGDKSRHDPAIATGPSRVEGGSAEEEEAGVVDAVPLTAPFSLNDPAEAATIPAALAASPTAARPNDDERAEVARLAEDFLERIGGGSEDPRDPAYQERWAEAQEDSDARMRASLGGHAWLDHHRDVHREAHDKSAKTERNAPKR